MKFKSDKQRKAVMSQLNPSQSDGFHKRMKANRDKNIYTKEEMKNIPVSGYDRKEQGIDEKKYQRSKKEYGFPLYGKEYGKEYAEMKENEAKGKIPKNNQEWIKAHQNLWREKDTFSEKDVNLVKRRLNDGKIKNQNEIFGDEEGNYTNKKLSDDQQRKGKDWLMNQWKSPTGVERKNNPMRNREQEILTNFDRIELKEYHDISRYGQRPYYVPLYQAYGKDGDSMEYYVDSKGINIIG